MAEFVVGGKVTIDASSAEKSVGSIKQQLREAQKELLAVSDQFGATSVEAINAAKKVANFKDAIGDAKLLTDAFNPDAKFKSFSNALQGVVGGFAAVQGAQALLGAESEDVAKVLAKVQGAMALSQGLNSILEAKDAFKVLGSVIKINVVGAFSTLKGAIISTGIGALIVGIGILIQQMSAMADAAEEAAEAQKKLNEQQKKYADEGLKSELKYLERQEKLTIAKAKLAGKNENEIFEIQQDYRAQKLRSQERYYEEVKGIDTKAASDTLQTIKDGIIEGQVAEADNQLKQIEKQKEHNKKLKALKDEENKKILAANEDANKQTRALQEENYLNTIKDEDARAIAKIQLDYENKRKEINASVVGEKEKQALLKELEINATNEIISINDAKNQKLAESNKAALDQAQALADENYLHTITNENDRAKAKADMDYQKHIEEVNAMQISEFEKNSLLQQYAIQHQNAMTDIEAKNAEARKQIATEEANAKIAAAQFAADSLASISQLVGQDTAAGKALAIAAATVSTYLSAQKAYESQFKPLAIYDSPIRGAIAAGIAIANGLATVKKIASVQIPGKPSGGGSAGSKPTFATPPLPPQLQTTTLNQGQIQQMGNAAVRSFVLESDVSGNQERIRRLNRAARIS